MCSSRVPAALLCAMLAAASWLSAPRSAHAAGGPVLVPGIGPVVRAGESVRLAWTDVPREVEEVEILLSLDDGRHWNLRVTPELDAREREFVWRVPNLASANARLRIRSGTRRLEFEGAPSAPFEIVADPSRPPDRAAVHEGTWWNPDRRAPAPREALGTGAREQLAGAAPGAGAAETPTRESAEAIERHPHPGGASGAVAPAIPPARTTTATPRFIPARE